MKIELLGVKYYFHGNKMYLISTNYEWGYKEEEQLIFIENWTEDMNKYKGKVFNSQEEVLTLCDAIVNPQGWYYPKFLYDCAVKITEGSNISYKLYRRRIGYYYFDSIEKNIEVISYGLYSKGLFRDTLDSDFHKLIQLEEESDREKRHKAKQISKRRDRQHREKYCI